MREYYDDEKSFEKNVAISTNFLHIQNMAKEKGFNWDYNKILKVSIWNYKTFGFGYVSIEKYIESFSYKNTERLYNVDVKLWYSLLKIIFKRDNYTCVYCGKIGGKLEGDHKFPFSRGGTNDIDNLVTSCRKCNRQKKDKTVEEFNLWKIEKANNG